NVPYDYLGQFSYLENYFFEDPYLAELKVEVKEVAVPTYTVYKVKSGDTLGHIGARYGVGVSQIKKWNSLKSDALKIGQKLILYI
ncbi:MAG: LysM peptidoglycan-binding domain-containing protein, partial [Bacteroidetes bacterium]|nr:LysM peptidoglycan-binding domain-containing protein [Bacteroidota bacterium]